MDLEIKNLLFTRKLSRKPVLQSHLLRSAPGEAPPRKMLRLDFRHTVEHVPQVIRQVGIDPFDKALLAEGGILTDYHFTHHYVSEGINTIFVHQVEWFDDIPGGLGHFLRASCQPPAMRQDMTGRFQSGSVKHNRPVNRMSGKNILADQVKIRRPGGRFSSGGEIVAE